MLGKLGPYHEIALSCIITLNLWGRHTRIRAGTWLIDAIISIAARHVGASCVLRPPPSAFLRIFFVAACLSTTRFFFRGMAFLQAVRTAECGFCISLIVFLQRCALRSQDFAIFHREYEGLSNKVCPRVFSKCAPLVLPLRV